MSRKPKIGIYGCASCGGCDASLIDMAEELIDLARQVELVFWPTALDFRYRDIETMSDDFLDWTLINGAIRNREDMEMARLLRKKSRLIIAHGACAQLGGVIGLANLHSNRELMEPADENWANFESPDDVSDSICLTDQVMPLHRVIPVDAVIPGCPPSSNRMHGAIQRLLDATPVPAGHVFADTRALCATCPRRHTLPTEPKIDRFYRIHEKPASMDRCFLDQGIICLGPSTRGGCDGQCLDANIPCRGCFGPVDPSGDHGARSLSFLATWIRANDRNGIETAVSTLSDPAGLLYRYSLAGSILCGRIRETGT